MTPLRRKLLDDLIIRGLSENTQKSYVQSVTGLARHYRRRPDRLTAEEVQDYLLHLLKKRGLSPKTCNTVRHGLRFFYRITLGWPDPHFYLPGPKQPLTLPEVLSSVEVVRLFRVTTNRKHRALLMTTYATGLRVSEVTRLRVEDIDSSRRVSAHRTRQRPEGSLPPAVAAIAAGVACLLASRATRPVAVPGPDPGSTPDAGWGRGRL